MKIRANKLTAAEKRIKAVQLRQQGMTLEQISNQLSMSVTITSKYLREALDELADEQYTDTEDYRTLQMLRLEGLLSLVWEKVAGGDLNAVDKARQLIDQMSILMNLYAPTEFAHTHGASEDAQIVGVNDIIPILNSIDEWLMKAQTEASDLDETNIH
jgi:orotate phosphoribosyltransferase-like protein